MPSFVCHALPPSNTPTLPKSSGQRNLRASTDTSTPWDAPLPDKSLSRVPANVPYKPGSMSSDDSATMTPVSSIDIEKASFAGELDPERLPRTVRHGGQHSSSNEKPAGEKVTNKPFIPRTSSNEDDEDMDLEESQTQEKNGVRILLYLAGPCVMVSLFGAVWTCIALVLTTLSQPIRLCAKWPSFRQQMDGLLGPTFNLQLKYIYTPLPQDADEDTSYRTPILIAVQLLSPFLSFIMMFAAWTLAVYWMSSAVVGDPVGEDKQDDGRDTVLALRRLWERWLMTSMKHER